MRTQLEEMLSRHSGQAVEKVRKDIDRDKILTAAEAKEYGLVDQVLASRKKTPRQRQVGSRVGRGGRGLRPVATRPVRPGPKTARHALTGVDTIGLRNG